MYKETQKGPICAVISFEFSLASISRKSIAQRDPGKLTLGPGMILWPQGFRVVHTSKRYVDGTGQVGALIGQSSAAFPTESSHYVRRRSIRCWLSLNKREFGSIKSRPCNKRRAARAPTSSAVAMCDPVRFTARTIAHRATETATLDKSHEHLPSLATVCLSAARKRSLEFNVRFNVRGPKRLEC